MSCEDCAKAYNEGYEDALNAESARFRERVDALVRALEEAKVSLTWATGGWGLDAEDALILAREIMRDNIDIIIGAALRAYKEETP